jgi:hypothetical protein
MLSLSRSPSLWTDREVLTVILSHTTNVERPTFPADRHSQLFFSALQFPTFSASDVKSILSELEQNEDFRSVLVKHSFSFPFAPERLVTLFGHADKSTSSFACLVAFYTYCTWAMLLVDSSGLDRAAIQILESLAVICDRNFSCPSKQLRQAALSTFVLMYLEVLPRRLNAGISEILSVLISFLRGRATYPISQTRSSPLR